VIVFNHNIPEIIDKLTRIQALIDGGYQKEVVRLANRVRDRVAELTPKSSGEKSESGQRGNRGSYGGHLRDGWTVHTIGGKAKSRTPIMCTIYNKKTHKKTGEHKKSALLMSKSKGKKDYTVLEVLEYGSPPHTITPVDKKFLRFIGDRGQPVFAKHVEHPGTVAYSMVRLTHEKMNQWGKMFNRRWTLRLKKEWGI
jgi:hypothetical protein